MKKIYATYKGHKSEQTFLLSGICLILVNTWHCHWTSKRFEKNLTRKQGFYEFQIFWIINRN